MASTIVADTADTDSQLFESSSTSDANLPIVAGLMRRTLNSIELDAKTQCNQLEPPRAWMSKTGVQIIES
jgi:hypothetical protein